MKVHLLNEDDEIQVVVFLNDKGVAVEEPDGNITVLLGPVLGDLDRGQEVHPDDGEEFLQALTLNYRSPYLRAEIVED